MEYPRRSSRSRGLHEGVGFPSLSREISLRVRNLNDPNGYYKLLGVEPWAKEDEIKKQYYRLSKRYHPDGSSPDKSRFLRVKRAYWVLMNRREEYNSTPEGYRWREEDESGEKKTVQSGESVQKSGFSYYYSRGEDDELSERWYRALLKTLPEWGFRSHISLRLGSELSVRGRLIEVPYSEPTPAALFLIGLQL